MIAAIPFIQKLRLLLVVLACLLSAPALAAFTDNGDGTVTDTATGLMWKRCSEGQSWTGGTCSGSATLPTWDAAAALTDSYAGHTDWRLPSVTELQSLVKLGAVPTIDTTAFPNTPASDFWSGSSYVPDPTYAWHVFFYNGNTNTLNKTHYNYVRLVRGGQSSSATLPVCTLTATPASIGLGDTLTLTASCSPAATYYSWSGGSCAGNTTNTCTASPAATTAYTVAGINASGTGAAASATVTVAAPTTAMPLAPVAAAQVVEFYNTNLDNYFITSDVIEAVMIDSGSAGAGWSRTGNSFSSGGSTSVCRFYGSQSPGPNSHFYTVDASECAGLKLLQASTPDTQKRWNFESLDFVSTPPTGGTCPGGTVAVYRAYNNGNSRGIDSNHRITSSTSAIQEVVNRGWNNEGVVMCAPGAQAFAALVTDKNSPLAAAAFSNTGSESFGVMTEKDSSGNPTSILGYILKNNDTNTSSYVSLNTDGSVKSIQYSDKSSATFSNLTATTVDITLTDKNGKQYPAVTVPFSQVDSSTSSVKAVSAKAANTAKSFISLQTIHDGAYVFTAAECAAYSAVIVIASATGVGAGVATLAIMPAYLSCTSLLVSTLQRYGVDNIYVNNAGDILSAASCVPGSGGTVDCAVTVIDMVTTQVGSLFVAAQCEATQNFINGKCVAPTPTAPTNLTATAGDVQATIRWNAVSGATSYNLYRASYSGVSKSSSQTTKASGVTSPYTQYNLSNGTNYYFVVTAVNVSGESSESAEVLVTPKAAVVATNGACGSANGVSVSSSPTSGYCSAGTQTSVTGSGPWYWSCSGSNGGTSASCSAPKTVTATNGACGSANGVSVSSSPTSGYCSAGTQTSVTGSGPWNWSCSGSNGGTSASCSAPKTVPATNGECGSADGVSVSSSPTSGYCSAGTQTSVTGSGPWYWSCSGSNGGSSASCWAPETPIPTYGECGSADGVSVSSSPTSGYCSAGTQTSVTGSGPWYWSCNGSNGGSSASCWAPQTAPPVAQCSSTQVAGNDTADTRMIELGQASGVFDFTYHTFTQRDQIQVKYQGNTLFDTGCVGASGTQTLSYSGSSTQISVEVIPNCAGGSGTAWNYTAACPAGSGTGTSPSLPAGYISQGGLTWSPNALGQGATEAAQYPNHHFFTWPEADAYCASFNGLDLTGWRLPSKDELVSLYNSGALAGASMGWWDLSPAAWSQTQLAAGNHYIVGLNYGTVYSRQIDTFSFGSVTCVR